MGVDDCILLGDGW